MFKRLMYKRVRGAQAERCGAVQHKISLWAVTKGTRSYVARNRNCLENKEVATRVGIYAAVEDISVNIGIGSGMLH